MSVQINANAVVNDSWTNFKAVAITSKNLPVQYTDDGVEYTIFAFDDNTIAYVTTIWKGTVPDSVISNGYSQSQNDTDKSDFETNYKANANSRISNSISQRTVLNNTTVTSGGSQVFSGIDVRQVNLFINCTQAFTGGTPGIQFTIAEVDPGDQTTVIGTSITGAAIFSSPSTQEISLNLTTSSTIKVSWIIVGTGGPTFPGMYVTLVFKPTTVFSGVDAGGTERVFQPDSSGRLLVSGSNASGAAVTVNPIIIGGVNPGGVAGYSQLASDNSLIVNDGGNYQPIFLNATVNSSSISNLLNVGDGTVYLFINVKNAPTGTNPTLTFSIYELDPGDKATPLRSTVTGATITAAGTQVLTLPATSSGIIQVSWTIGGTNSPTFTGVYVSAICKTGVSMSDIYGELYNSALNAMVFEANTATAGTGPGTSIGTSAAFTLYNPKTSTRNLVVQEINMAYVSGTLGSGIVYLCANTNPAANAPTGTSITPVPTLIGSAATAQAQAFTASTLPASPTVVRALWTLTPMTASSVFQPFVLEEITYGKYIILPGCALSLEAVGANGSNPKAVFSMSWVEVPF